MNLVRHGARRGEFFTNKITSGNMRYTEKLGETTGVCALADTGATQKNPLDIPVLGIFTGEIVDLRIGIGLSNGSRRRRIKVESFGY